MFFGISFSVCQLTRQSTAIRHGSQKSHPQVPLTPNTWRTCRCALEKIKLGLFVQEQWNALLRRQNHICAENASHTKKNKLTRLSSGNKSSSKVTSAKLPVSMPLSRRNEFPQNFWHKRKKQKLVLSQSLTIIITTSKHTTSFENGIAHVKKTATGV